MKLDNDKYVQLRAKTAKAARSEIRANWPNLNVQYKGYDEDGECVLMSLVRKTDEKGNVATVTRNRSKKPVKFVAEVNE